MKQKVAKATKTLTDRILLRVLRELLFDRSWIARNAEIDFGDLVIRVVGIVFDLPWLLRPRRYKWNID